VIGYSLFSGIDDLFENWPQDLENYVLKPLYSFA
jgi:hypothetical protein